MARVWIVHRPTRRLRDGSVVDVHDFSPALGFGELAEVFGAQVKPQDSAAVEEALDRLTCEFEEGDFLLLAGSPYFIARAAQELAAYREDVIPRYLYWTNRRYEELPA